MNDLVLSTILTKQKKSKVTYFQLFPLIMNRIIESVTDIWKVKTIEPPAKRCGGAIQSVFWVTNNLSAGPSAQCVSYPL